MEDQATAHDPLEHAVTRTPADCSGPDRRWVHAAALVVPPLVCLAVVPWRDRLETANAALLLVLVVVGVAATGARVAALLAALSASLWLNVLLTQPYGELAVADPDDVQTVVLLGLVGLAVGELALWGRRQQGQAGRQAGYLDGVARAGRMVADGDAPPAAVCQFVERQVVEVLGVDSCVFRRRRPGGHPRLHPDGSVTQGERTIDVDRSGLPVGDVLELPVRSGGRVLGVLQVTATSTVAWTTAPQRVVAVALADQLGAALARTT